jgi:thioredoxin reductase (NADPH)
MFPKAKWCGVPEMLTHNARSTPLTSAPTASLMFPTLTTGQVARIEAHGVVRVMTRGQVLIESGQSDVPFFVVKSGELEIIRPSTLGDLVVGFHRAGQFTGEISMLLGRPAMMRVCASESGAVVQLSRDQMHTLIQTDADLSEVLMTALLHRRLELVAQGIGDALLIGSAHSAATARIKAFLTRNDHPFTYLDLDRDADVKELLNRFQVDLADIPVLVYRGNAVLKNPSNQTIADRLGFNDRIDQVHVRDVVIVGAGPAGLAAAVYAASEGLDTLVIEQSAPGGQAGSSSKIENYLGFPAGVSGHELAGRAYVQAQKFGASILIARAAAELRGEQPPYTVILQDGATIPARTVIIATGARYRRPSLTGLARFEGAGVYYSATFMEEAQLGDDEVVVVGGANSAGQAAVFLAQSGRTVHVLVRSDHLSAGMSRYLVRRLEETPAVQVHPRTEIVALEGNDHLERVQWRDASGTITSHEVRHVFLMTGAEASSGWLSGDVALDSRGFIKTGLDLVPEDLAAAKWPLDRSPHLLETSRPGVFAVGDVRCGNVKRVATAVGEGAIAISLVHRVLAG